MIRANSPIVSPREFPVSMLAPLGATAVADPRAECEVDWPGWLRRADRKRRLAMGTRRVTPGPEYFLTATYSSFALADMNIGPGQVAEAIEGSSNRRTFRSRQNQRIRNHIAILYQIESLLQFRKHLTVDTVLRWYTSISCGLSTYPLDGAMVGRLQNATCDISTPQPRLKRAVVQMAGLHVALLNDPIFPAFNSILARLLLRYHLGRHGLPPVMFDPAGDRGRMGSVGRFVPLLTERVEGALDGLLARPVA